jgi:hypothetical protein
MPNPAHQQAAARVAILTRWRPADDPELLHAQRLLNIAQAESRLTDATEALAEAGEKLGGAMTAQPEHRYAYEDPAALAWAAQLLRTARRRRLLRLAAEQAEQRAGGDDGA